MHTPRLAAVLARAAVAAALLSAPALLAGCGEDDPAAAPDAATGDAAPDAAGDAGPDGGDAPPADDATDDATDDAADDADAGPDAGPPAPALPLVAAAGCAPSAGACAAAAIAPGTLHAALRKDFRLDNAVYTEELDPPTSGGRVQVAAVAQASGTVTGVFIDGVDAHGIYAKNAEGTPAFEWYHVWPREVVAGGPIWVAFHSLDPKWDAAASATLRVETDGGVAVDGTFPVATPPAPITYVTTDEALETLLVHVANRGAAPVTIARVLVNGSDVTGPGAACVPVPTLAPGEATLVRVPLCAPTAPGAPWTAVVEYADAPAAVGVGRVLPPRFPLGAWQNTSECAFPGGDEANYARLRDAGVDTIYFHGGVCAPQNCDCDTVQVLAGTLPATEGLYTWAASDLAALDFPTTERISVFATGDESEWHIYDDESGVPIGAQKAAKSVAAWARYPEVPTFNGGFTHNHIGIVAGMADIQGLDHYNAACAPHITVFGVHPPPRAPYDYLRNTRDNHMPGATWLYAQGLHTGWSYDSVQTGERVHAQPDPQEILLQAISVPAAGGKGLLWFQLAESEAEAAPERWQAIADATWRIRGVRRWLREGDITGMITLPDGVIGDVVRARDALVVLLANVTPDPDVEQPTDDACILAKLNSELYAVPHHVFAARTATVTVDVPPDLGIADLFEVRAQAVADVPWPLTADGRRLTLHDVPLSNDEPVRVLVLAASEAARAEALAAMGVEPAP